MNFDKHRLVRSATAILKGVIVKLNVGCAEKLLKFLPSAEFGTKGIKCQEK